MGNCCQKKKKTNQNAVPAAYTKTSAEEVKLGSGLTDNLVDIHATENGSAHTVNGQVDIEAGSKLDPVCWRTIKEFNLKDKLDQVEQRVKSYNKADLKLISDPKDPFTLYFDVFTDEKKEKYHTTFMTAKSNLSPLAYKLANSLISEADELEMSSSYERFSTIFRAKVDGVFYICNHASYKKIMLFSKKDLIMMKAFKETENGDVVEITVSFDHPDYPEKKDVDRITIIETIAYYRKTPEGGTEINTLNTLYPRVGTGFMILKPVYSRSFRTFNGLLTDYMSKMTKSTEQLEAEFVNFP